MLHISVMWHTACFSLSLSIGPRRLHLCVICRKFHLHANFSEFGHSQAAEFLPLSRSPPREQDTHTQTHTKRHGGYYWNPASSVSTLPVTAEQAWTHQRTRYMQNMLPHINLKEFIWVEAAPMTPPFVVLSSWMLHADGAIAAISHFEMCFTPNNAEQTPRGSELIL